MTSTKEEIDRSYSVSNDFFKLWLDDNMHYTSAVFDDEHTTLEAAQENKVRRLYRFAEVTPEKRVLDIGCGWGSAIDVITRLGCKEAVGITLSDEQVKFCHDRNISNATFKIQDYATYEPADKYDALVSIEMIDHLVSPKQQRDGLAVDIYRQYFNKLASWVEPGDCFGFQAILRNRIPRNREHLDDLRFTADVIFPGGLNPRIEELVAAISPRWELIELHMMREDYGKTTAEWYRRLRMHEATIRERWGDQVYDDYDRYLNACVRQFRLHYSGDVQMKLRRID
ncbi:MAG: cyclopropane-fatty-acyl-phospholipid synthase [Proteobacteria bacterium]|nr:MAG: cyclopropane-fatty-acyl-phospholipid synthase [Pseudomonadota bacterium]